MALIYTPESTIVSSVSSSKATSILSGSKWKNSPRTKSLNNELLKNGSTKKLIDIEYIEENKGIKANGKNVFINSQYALDIFGPCPIVNLTSVDVGEIWVLLRLLAQGILEEINFYYCSPQSYKGVGIGKKSKSEPLSTSLGSWYGLPGLATEWNSDELSFRQYSALGFDLYRLGSIDSYEGFPDHQEEVLLLADPPTSPYWVERSLRENHALIKKVITQSNSGCETVLRVPGTCPASAASFLTDIFQQTSAERWCILPLGPRVLTLGVLMFTSNCLEKSIETSEEPTVGILYDFPKPIDEDTEMLDSIESIWSYSIKRYG